ncbi:MAG: NAD(P)-dependent alcohol dehydrogenase [Candidatus Nanopelagicales bacterium]
MTYNVRKTEQAKGTDMPTSTLPTTMDAAVQDRYGPAHTVEIRRMAMPETADNEVLVRVKAAGLDRGVVHLMTGLPYPVRLAGYGLRAPKYPVLGMDLSGVVERVGKDVTRFRPGDEVFGIGKGTFAEYSVALESKLAPKPANLTFEQAAAVAISGLTALQGVRDHTNVESGQSLLVIGASGGVGSYAVQIAKAYGIEVTGVCSTSKVDLVRSIGADHVIDYQREQIDARGNHYDAILDIGGNRQLSQLRSVLSPRGTLVIVGSETGGRWLGGTDRQLRGMVLSLFVSQRLGTFISRESGDDLAVLGELMEAGKVTPVIDKVYPLAEVRTALGDLESGRARGKLVIAV